MYKSEEFLKRFKRIGANVQVYEHSLILKPEEIELSDYSRLDDYCRIEGGMGVTIGNYVHICSFASIFGGGKAVIGDYCGISQGVRLITGTEQITGVMSASAPNELRNVMWGTITMEPNSFIAANAVVLPDIVIGEGSVVAPCSVVRKDVEPWTVVAGAPARVVSRREPLDFTRLRSRFR